MHSKLSHIRSNYIRQDLRRENLEPTPVLQLRIWINEAIDAEHPEPTAISLATVDVTGQPSQRIVLMKEISDKGVVFFTNYQSRKGQHIVGNSKASASLFWPLLERQVRLEGRVQKIPEHESDVYFASRPRESQIGAWTSPQSEIVQSETFLSNQYQEVEKKYEGKSVPRPPHWGGYVLVPHRVEFWQGRPGRLHDRFEYRFNTDGSWSINRLAP